MKFSVQKIRRLCLCALLCTPITIFAQSRTVSGKVTDQNGDPLIGVSIGVKGTSTGTSSSMGGEYQLMVPSGASTLVVSFIGYLKKEVPITGNQLNIVLNQDPRALEEVVVVGYGTQKRSDVTGSIATLSGKKIQEVPVQNAAAALQGRIPGVLVDRGSSRPGEGVRVQIRGRRSITASNDPLYVIDGIPLDGSINDVDPDDIESMDVLKDASATAIYGSRGANGVVLITTRRGKAGKVNVRYSGFIGRDEVYKRETRMSAAEFVEYRREAQRMDGKYPEGKIDKVLDLKLFDQDYYTGKNINAAWASGEYDPSKLTNTDWGSHVLRTGINSDHHISLTAGTEQTKVLFSLGYQKQTGVIKSQDYYRWDGRLTIDQQATKNIKVGMVNYFANARQNYGRDLFEGTATSNPLASPYDTTGQLILSPANDSQVYSALLDINGVTRERRRARYMGSFYGEVKLPFHFRYRLNFGLDYGQNREGEFQGKMSSARQGNLSWGKVSNDQRFSYNLQNLLYYDNKFKKHSLGVTLLQEIQGNRSETSTITGQDFPYESQKWYNLNTAVVIVGIGSNFSSRKLASFMGRVNYNYDNRYLLTVSYRADGSSTLSANNKWAYFPSLALAWRISQEKFLKESKIIDDLKLRVGVGKSGNASVGAYRTLGSLSLTRYNWVNGTADVAANGFRPDLIPNPLLSWENTLKYNIALEFSLLKNRISGKVEYYRDETSDLLLDRELPRTSGFDDITQNVGATQNNGWEFSLSTVNIDTKNFRWTTDFMYSANREKIVSLYKPTDDIGNGWFIGQPVDVYFTQKKIGIWQNTAEDAAEMAKFNAKGAKFKPGTIRIQDQNGDYVINGDDRVIQGNANPRWMASLNSHFFYKNWELSFFLITRQKYILENNQGLSFQGRYNTAKVDYWTPQNPTNAFPRPNAGLDNPDYNGTMYFQDASNVRLRNISIGYKVPASVLRRIGIAGFRIYATGQNLFVHAPNFSGLDPEVYNDDNGRPARTPSIRSMLIGVSVDF